MSDIFRKIRIDRISCSTFTVVDTHPSGLYPLTLLFGFVFPASNSQSKVCELTMKFVTKKKKKSTLTEKKKFIISIGTDAYIIIKYGWAILAGNSPNGSKKPFALGDDNISQRSSV